MVSIIIPTLKEQDYIRVAVEKLLSLKFQKGLEIIVVDSSPDDLTRKAVKDLPVKIFIEKIRIIGRGKWRGFKEAKGDILVGMDADALVDQAWVEQVERLYQEEMVAITGPFYYYDAKTVFQKTVGRLVTAGDYFRAIFLYRYFPLRGGNMAIKKEAYFKAGQFDKTRTHREDAELSTRLRKVGKIVYSRKMKPGYSVRRLKAGLFQYIWEYTANFVVDRFKIKRKGYKLSIRR